MKRIEALDKLNRRGLLKGAGLAAATGALSSQFSASVLGWEDTSIVVEQGDSCVPIKPLSGQGDVVDFYGYNPSPGAENARQSNTGLERAGTSRMFLYDGPNGFSVVFLQGGGPNEQGGAATFLVCGLSPEGEWVVLDDNYEGGTDEFVLDDQEAVLNWTWGAPGNDGRRNDGAVFRGLDQQFCVTVAPAFNENAKLDPSDGGEVTGWQILSGDVENPQVIDLDPNRPVTIRTGECGGSSTGCTIGTASVDVPFEVTATFCCLSVMIDAGTYDRVYLTFQDGTDQRFAGPFEGLETFTAIDDGDTNAKEEVIRSIVVESDGERVRIDNPNVERCLGTVERAPDDEDADEEPQGS